METIIIQETIDTPRITLDYNNLHIKIEGPSYPENAFLVYSNVLKWLNEIGDQYDGALTCDFGFCYISSASKKLIFEILIILEELYDKEKEVVVNWIYEKQDEDMIEMGEEYAEMLEIPINIIQGTILIFDEGD